MVIDLVEWWMSVIAISISYFRNRLEFQMIENGTFIQLSPHVKSINVQTESIFYGVKLIRNTWPSVFRDFVSTNWQQNAEDVLNSNPTVLIELNVECSVYVRPWPSHTFFDSRCQSLLRGLMGVKRGQVNWRDFVSLRNTLKSSTFLVMCWRLIEHVHGHNEGLGKIHLQVVVRPFRVVLFNTCFLMETQNEQQDFENINCKKTIILRIVHIVLDMLGCFSSGI